MSEKIEARKVDRVLAAGVVYELMNEMQVTSENLLAKYKDRFNNNDLLLINARAANGRAIFLAQNIFAAVNVRIDEAEKAPANE